MTANLAPAQETGLVAKFPGGRLALLLQLAPSLRDQSGRKLRHKISSEQRAEKNAARIALLRSQKKKANLPGRD